ncbi:hypothetical protein BSKO_03420 [Bryopsis sp. KO-2023]|nr:hypothetical protein BSKO_03420 [Bryopsis sp. KO-2023]
MQSGDFIPWSETSALDPKSPVLATALRILKERLTRLMEHGGVGITGEYDRVREVGNPSSDSHCCSEASSRRNSNKNRYINIVPYDSNRVRLGDVRGYINASTVESAPGEIPFWSFISTQGPLRSTIEDFWQMAFEQKCTAIVMLTRVVEKHHEKCAQYFPLNKKDSCTHGDFKVSVEDAQDNSMDITVRNLRLTQLSTGMSTSLTHYHYHEWPDHRVPEYTRPIRDLINMLERTGQSSGKVIVHCSAGVGRTGTFCAVHVVLKRLRHLQAMHEVAPEKIEHAVNVMQLVGSLRNQRMGMVQTLDQYYFCYQTIIQELDSVLKGRQRQG